MDLRTTADSAEDAAAGFRMFREPLPDDRAEITDLIAELFTISSSLRTFDDLAGERRYRRTFVVACEDLDLIRTSLNFTIEDIVDFFGSIEPSKPAPRDAYRKTWRELRSFFRKEAGYTLASRLGKYTAFLKELKDMVKEYV